MTSVRALILVPLLLVPASVGAWPSGPWGERQVESLEPKHGAVACESKVCSEVGGNMLKLGGSAADAIIATVLCVGVVDAHHSGIGGGGFALAREPEGKYAMIDFRETAPALANETMFSDNPNPLASIIGGLAVATPGELRGLETLHKLYGKLPWKSLVQPASNLARNGFVVQPILAARLAEYAKGILADPTWAAVYAPNGTLLIAGQTAYRPTYAATLDTIGEKGASAFYEGPIAEATVAAAQARNGILSLSDLQGYESLIRCTANISYKGQKVTSTIAPSSGTIVLSALNILDGYKLDSVPDPTQPGGVWDSPQTAHLIVESMKFAFGQRTVLGDPAFVHNVTELEYEFLTPKTAAEIRARLPLNHTGFDSIYDPTQYAILSDHGTSQVVSADSDGLVISLTTTINLYFGSLIMVKETGVILNNEMDDFSSPNSSNAAPSNFIAPGKKPLSSISPAIIEDADGNFIFATGATGGTHIIGANIQVIHHHVDQGLTPLQAITSPRLHDQIFPAGTTYENGSVALNVPAYPDSNVAYLASFGHKVQPTSPGLSIAASIGYKDGKFDPASDPRMPGSGAVVV